MNFEVTEKQKKSIEAWSKEQDQKTIQIQGNKNKFPYYGCSGGQLTYEFSPTWIGLVVKVRHAVTKEVIDVTDYDDF